MAKVLAKRPRKCVECGVPLLQGSTGRPRKYHSDSCRQRAYERRRARRENPTRTLRSDVIEALKFRRSVRREVLRVLAELGVMPPDMTADDLKRMMEVADLEAQFELPPKRRRKN